MIEAGCILGGKYELVEPVGKGGMGTVWRAIRLDLNAIVAVKIMLPEVAKKPGARERFTREAQIAANLRSPHAVQILDFAVDSQRDVAFLVMEMLEGETLRERLERTNRLSIGEVARWVTQIARALTRAHAAGVVHRDLKPDNLFIVDNEDDELLKILDFGIARPIEQSSSQFATATGVLLGSPHYMSPEQLNGQAVNERTDLWSLGVIACRCLTGGRPFDGDSLPTLAVAITTGRASIPSSIAPVPPGFDEWFSRATQLDPSERFDSAAAMASALQDIANGATAGGETDSKTDKETDKKIGQRPDPLRLPLGPTLTPDSLKAVNGARPELSLSRHWADRRLWWAAVGLSLICFTGFSVYFQWQKTDTAGQVLTETFASVPSAISPVISQTGSLEKPTPGVVAKSDPMPAPQVLMVPGDAPTVRNDKPEGRNKPSRHRTKHRKKKSRHRIKGRKARAQETTTPADSPQAAPAADAYDLY